MPTPFTWIVTWGRPGRRDWKVVHVEAYDADEALQAAREDHPHLLPPDAAILAAPAPGPSPAYDRIGQSYAEHRRPDPRWAAAIHRALGGAPTVVNVGAGTGSYEPSGPTAVVAVEPSLTMIAQRPPGSAPVVQGVAEALPFPDRSFAAALAVLTTHHWTDPAAGLAELRRVADRQVVVTWDPAVFAEFWLVREYVPEVAEWEKGLATLDAVVAHLPGATVIPLPVASDCEDGVLGAHWRRPDTYLDAGRRQASSGIALLDPAVVDRAMNRLAADLASGEWHRRHAELLEMDEIDLGYRLVSAGAVR